MLLNLHKPLKSSILNIETVKLKELFSFNNFKHVTRKWENKSAPIKLVIRSETFYFLTSS